MNIFYFWLGFLVLAIVAGITTLSLIFIFGPILVPLKPIFGEPIARFIGGIVFVINFGLINFLAEVIQKKIMGDTFWGKWKKM